MEPTENKLLTKRNIIAVLVLLILAAVIPVAVNLVQKSQVLRSRAAATDPIIPVGPNIITTTPGAYTATDRNIQLQLTADYPAQATPNP